MRQKIESFRKQIRREQIQGYFNARRGEAEKKINNQSVFVPINVELASRRRVMFEDWKSNEEESISIESFEERNLTLKWDNDQEELIRLRDSKEYQKIAKIMNGINIDFRRIHLPSKNGLSMEEKDQLFSYFLRKSILCQVIDITIQAFFQNKSAGLLQSLSKKATSILDSCIFRMPRIFDEQMFINSNLLLFLRCAIDQPKHDFKHLSKVVAIICHMILVSSKQKASLFALLNSENSKFHIRAIFFNFSQMPLSPFDILTQNVIIMLKFYLQEVEWYISEAKKKDKTNVQASSFTCLTLNELEIGLQVAGNVVNSMQMACFDNQEMTNCLEQALEVIRITIQNFKVKDRYKHKINFRKMLQFLTLKDCIIQIKTQIFAILDHLVYIDINGAFDEVLIKEFELLQVIWPLRDDFSGYVMNIMSNLALDSNLKQFMSKYVHNIFLKLQYDSNDYMLFTFMYNWFSSQNFQILESMQKLMVQRLAESTHSDARTVELQCMFWYQLGMHNEIEIPKRILQFDLPIVKKIKDEVLSLGEQVL